MPSISNRAKRAAEAAAELAFQPSADPTIGVELELPIIDPGTGDLVPGATRILDACAEESLSGVSGELMETMIEFKTGVCKNVDEVRSELLPLMRRVRKIAGSMNCELAMFATHPFHRSEHSPVSHSERSEHIQKRLAWMIHQRVVFGMHVHVGVPSGDLAIGTINTMVQHLPHLVAVSANSPFWRGTDTGLASCRTAFCQAFPHSGVPAYFSRWSEFQKFASVMQACHAIDSPKDLYWDIRPRADLGTIEIRICDQPPSLANVLAIVALIRTLAVAALRLLEESPSLRRGDIRRHWIAVENKWLATRYGLDAMYIRTPGGRRRALADDLSSLVEGLMPVARETGDDEYLATLLPIDKFESGAWRQRDLYRQTGDWKSLVADMTQQLSTELEAPDPK